MKLSIKEKLDQKNISRYELAKRIGVSYPTIDSIYKGNSTSIKFDILESICVELECTPNDILISENKQMERLLAYASVINKTPRKSDTK